MLDKNLGGSCKQQNLAIWNHYMRINIIFKKCKKTCKGKKNFNKYDKIKIRKSVEKVCIFRSQSPFNSKMAQLSVNR